MYPKSNSNDETIREEEITATTQESSQTHAGALYPGMLLKGRYLVEKELGKGGIGAVYLARDQQLVSKPVVIKVLLDASHEDDYLLKKFKHEVEALARISQHPGIVDVLDSGEMPDGRPFIVMEYVDGVNLRSVMKPEGMDLERAASIIKQIGHALSAAHEKGIVHRDLKPENIMLQTLRGGIEQVIVIDFGIAKVKDSQMAPSTVAKGTAGTIAYMAPEQLNARPVTEATDIYAVGAIAYEMLTGRRPFNPETMFQLAEMQRAGVRVKPSDLRPSIPLAAQDVILKALAYHPNDRYYSAGDFGEELARALMIADHSVFGDSISQAETVPLTPHAGGEQKSGTRSYRAPIIAIALAALVVAIGIMAWFYTRPKIDVSPQEKAAPPATAHVFSYSFTVQKMRHGKPFQEPFESSGQEYFENGWKFRLNISSPQSGFLYLLNEGPVGAGSESYNLLFPTPSTNSGQAQLAADQRIETPWYVLDQNPGTERLWMVWATHPVTELEALRGLVNPNDRGTISDPRQANTVREFLAKYTSPQTEVVRDKVNKLTVVKGGGDILLNMMELEHH